MKIARHSLLSDMDDRPLRNHDVNMMRPKYADWRSGTITILLMVVLIGSVFFTMRVASSYWQVFSSGVVRLTEESVRSYVVDGGNNCTSLETCDLMPGDILFRRFVTSRTQLYDYFFHPYFTHVAFYVGDGAIIEAVGPEDDPKDDIQIRILNFSDWMDRDIEGLTIVRPRYGQGIAEKVSGEVRRIADDPEYTFGIADLDSKKRTCSGLITKLLADEGVISGYSATDTPDYLFSTLLSEKKAEVVGYRFADRKK